MIRVGIVKDWTYLKLFRQTPSGKMVWEDVQFFEEPFGTCDYVIVLNKPGKDTVINCIPDNLWSIMLEPPNEIYGWMHRGDISSARVYTTDPQLQDGRYRHGQPALYWLIQKDYDFLVSCLPLEKERNLSWITSNRKINRGHRLRMKFLSKLQNQIELDLYGWGLNYIKDKWDGLAPYRYSLAIENFSNSLYWSEKICDCLLAWTMPIYYGCTRITEFLPAEAMIKIDIHDPDCIEIVRQAVLSDAWRRNRDAIAYARNLILNRYQFFPFVVQEIRDHEAAASQTSNLPQDIFLPSKIRVQLDTFERLRRIWRYLTPVQLRSSIARIRYLFER